MNNSKYNSRVLNLSSKTNNSTFKLDRKKIMSLLLIVLLILFILYVLISYYNYQSIECYKKNHSLNIYLI